MASKRGNDAIPSWSGFNYQGKVMLLYILQKMNTILGKVELSEYSVELEKKEDFVILHNGKSESFHQVKATLSKSKWSYHIKALNKLLQHRNTSDNPVAPCYFMSASNIEDWNDTSNTYTSSITLFQYMGKGVGVCDVKNFIIEELKKFFKAAKYKNGDVDVVYGELCLFLDEKVAAMHRQGKKRIYTIAFSNFEEVIDTSISKTNAREEYYLKERIFEYSAMELQEALNNICRKECHNTLDNCTLQCAAKTSYQKILEIPDLIKYCKIINPNIIEGWDNELKLISNMTLKDMEKFIFHIFQKSKTPKLVDVENDSVFLHTKFCKAINQRIIPTLLDLSDHYFYNTQEAFQSIKDNVEILDALDGNAITAIPGGYEGSLSQAQITSGWTNGNIDNINNFYRGIEIISSKELLDKFKAEGGNHE